MLRSLLFVFSGLLFLCASQLQQGTHYCETCGRVCVNFCNTRDFRPCCINFIRKRSAPNPSAAIAASIAAQQQKSAPEITAPSLEQDNNDNLMSWQQRPRNNAIKHQLSYKSQPMQPSSLYYLYNAPVAANNALLESDV